MKSQNRIIGLILVSILSVAIVIICMAVFIPKPRENNIPPRPNDTNLEFWICDKIDRRTINTHEEYWG